MATIQVRLKSGEIVPMTHPDNWSPEQIESSIHENFPDEGNESSESSGATETAQPPAETTGWKGLKDDAIQSLAQAIKGGIGFARDVPNKLEKSGKYIEKNPGGSILHNAGQLAAGTASLGKGILNLPHDVIAELGRKELVPEWLKKYNELPFTHIPEDTGLEKALGIEADEEKGDDLMRAIPEIVTMGASGNALVRSGKKFFKAPDLKQTIRDTQAKVNQATSSAGKIFDHVEKEVGARGLSKIPVDKNVIKDAQSFLAKTPANREMIKKAKAGDYEALRSLQADLRVKGEKALSSVLAAENTMGEEILATRDHVNKSIQQHLEETGHEDLAKLLNKARKNYRDIQETYFSTPALAKVFGKSQKIPKNPKTLLTEESTEMKRFMSSHPEVKDALSKALKHEQKMKRLGRIGSIAGIGTSAEIAREVFAGKH